MFMTSCLAFIDIHLTNLYYHGLWVGKVLRQVKTKMYYITELAKKTILLISQNGVAFHFSDLQFQS